jgi:uncharacterized membrane protein YphA (DoxX/SURF4 family)
MKLWVEISRVIVGVIFLLSGWVKCNDITGFSYKLEEYFEVFSTRIWSGFEAFVPWALTLAAIISVFEMIIALLLLTGTARRTTTLLLLLMIIFFTLLTGWSAITQTVTDCGCFGDALKLTPWQSFYKDIFLMIFISILYLYPDEITPLFGYKNPFPRQVVNIAGSLIILLLTWYCYAYLPMVDFLPYKKGNDLKALKNQRKPDGQPVLKDYDGFCAPELEGNTFLIVFQDVEKAHPAVIEKMIALTRSLDTTKIKIVAGAGNTGSQLENFRKLYQPNFCISGEDKTWMKTMIRSNPGFFVLKNGVIVGKWHYNAMPEKATVEQLIQ